jgi:topoisomerase-4 subunit A
MSDDLPQQEFGFNSGEEPEKKEATPQKKPKRSRKNKSEKTNSAPKTTKNSTEAPDPPQDHNPMMDGSGPLRSMMDRNFLEYASYVICDRAIPTMEDGLKPVQRRILWSLHETDDGRFTKVANIVGHCMQYHPHGDASIADALVNLTNKRYLIEGQGNFGNLLTGDGAAASRYIECRLTELARNEIFNDDLTEFVPNYDGRKKEPVTLPSKLPLLLMLGAEGIAVGMSTRVLPHNFVELLSAQIAILQKRSFSVLPDFQQGGMMDVSEYEDGNGRVKLRARIKPSKSGRLVITELPYGTTTESLTASIEDAVRKKKVPVRAINDFTSENVEIELVLSPGTKPEKAIKALYAFTSCENAVTGRTVVIRKDRPVDSNVSEILRENTKQLVDVLRRELELKQKNLYEALHHKTLIQIFVEERIYKRIEECKTAAEVRDAIRSGFEPFKEKLIREITPDDIEMLLGVRIRRISLFDINKNRQEIEGILAELEQVKKHLAKLTPYVIRYLKNLIKTYGDEYKRLTEISTFSNIEVRELTAKELKICYDQEKGFLGYNVDGDVLFECSSYDKIIVVSKDGTYRVIQPPEKQFVDGNMIYCNKADRDRVYTIVYSDTETGFTYMKRFTTGGFIMDKEYNCAQEGAEVLAFEDTDPPDVYVKYKPSKGQRIHQQVFHPSDIPVKGSKARGNQMTAKAIARIDTSKPRWWQDDEDSHRGRLL